MIVHRPAIRMPRLACHLGLVFLLGFALSWGGVAGAKETASHQVTLFGIRAIPGESISDPELSKVLPQLRKILPDHGFQLLGTKNERRSFGERVECELGEGLKLRAELVEAELSGKIRMDVSLEDDGQEQFMIAVSTPLNQLFFLDKKLKGGDLLLIGVGAR